MATVFRVVKNCNYTTLSNYHFRDKRLSWKAKGLLSTMLSLPEDWNYTIEGLARLSGDGVKSTNSGLTELEKYGYIVRKQLRNDNGCFGATEYTIYEQPIIQEDESVDERAEPIVDFSGQPLCQNGQTDENTAFSPLCQKRQTEKRFAEKGRQLNTNILNTNILNSSSSTDEQNRMNTQQILDEEEESRLRERLELRRIMQKCSRELTEAVFQELCKRDLEFIHLMNSRALEQVCVAIMDKQRKEPIRMLPNLINAYLDNIILGLRASGGYGQEASMPVRSSNKFNDFMQNNYDFETLEKEILRN